VILRILGIGFSYMCLSIILGGFRRYFSGMFICIESGTISPRGGHTIIWRIARSKGLAGILVS
jgi:hypothetical protein